jgi:hypothetical protein
MTNAAGKNVLGPAPSDGGGHPAAERLRHFKYTSEVLKEYVFDEVRAVEFPRLPSRRRCMFLLDEVHDPEAYAAAIGFADHAHLYRVEVISGRLHRGDLAELRCNMQLQGEIAEHARRYWRGVPVGLSAEVLFEGICRGIKIAGTP